MSEQMPFPDHIAHAPVYALPYNALDPDRPGDTDVQFLSVGWSQWDRHELSAKIVRYSGKRWSRQSEEIPLSRLIDLASVVALVFERPEGPVSVDPDFFENQPAPMHIKQKPQKARDALRHALDADETLVRRLGALADVMIRLREEGRV